MNKLRLRKLDMKAKIATEREYEDALGREQLKMLSIQQCYFHTRQRAVIVLEGWDASGKGGLIRRLSEKLDPRSLKVWPIGKPEALEQGRHYLYRFWTKLPEPGVIAVFDRSWYGRVLVERIEGYAPKPAWKRAYGEINDFERMLIDDGVRVVKLFLHITPAEQRERFVERLTNPYKRWKLQPDDIRNHQKWDEYVEAIEDMFDRTSTQDAPWHAIAANHKWYARVTGLQIIAAALGKGVDLKPPAVDPAVARQAREILGLARIRGGR